MKKRENTSGKADTRKDAQTVEKISEAAGGKPVRAAVYRSAGPKKRIPEMESCTVVGTYVENGRADYRGSDRNNAGRTAMDRLLADCAKGGIDLVCTDSLRTFFQTVTDYPALVRRFADLGVDLYFKKEKIDTRIIGLDVFLVVIDAILGNETLRRSDYMKESIRRRFREGTYRPAIIPYGYALENDSLVIVPEQAEVVREIFAGVLAGTGAGTIRKKLNEKGIPSPSGGSWLQSEIRRLVANPIYMGDVVCELTDTEGLTRGGSDGQGGGEGDEEILRLPGHHEAIISPEDFRNAQLAVRQRAKECGRAGEARSRGKRKQYCFTGIMHCKVCGSVMHRHTSQKGEVSWLCSLHVAGPDRCAMKPAWDDDLKRAFMNVLNKLAWVQDPADGSNRILDHLETAGPEGSRSPDESLNAEAPRDFTDRGSSDAVRYLKDFLAGWTITADPAAFPETEFRSLVSSCIVDSGTSAVFCFRAGINLEESLRREPVEAEEQ